ncbi:MAG: cyclic nucleotide-binding domain-containing protein [Coriobacteriales bacterium]|nr:cyclic nucleotide-binding domain-containing protein [Coriobacteriales bacterium]
MKEQNYKKGETIFWEGDPGNCMYLVRWGSVGVFLNYATSKQKQLTTLRAGDYFGEMGLIDGEARSATVVVLERGTILERIGEDEFAEFLQTNPAMVHDILTQLCHKLRHATKEYLDVCKSLGQAVGNDTITVDESSNYHLNEDERLSSIHGEVQQSMAQDA